MKILTMLLFAGLLLTGCETPHHHARSYAPPPSPAPPAQPLTLADVKTMTKSGVSDEVILSQIRNSHTVYRLDTQEIIDLKDAGVSQRVIDFMINTANTSVAPPDAPESSATVYEEVVVPGPPPPPVYESVYVAPGPGFVWIGGSWRWWGGRWVWARGRWARRPHPHAIWIDAHTERRGDISVWIAGRWH
jgi:hypothetical protein